MRVNSSLVDTMGKDSFNISKLTLSIQEILKMGNFMVMASISLEMGIHMKANLSKVNSTEKEKPNSDGACMRENSKMEILTERANMCSKMVMSMRVNFSKERCKVKAS